MPTLAEIQAAYQDLLCMPAYELARAVHCQRALCVLRDIIAWAEQRDAEAIQNEYVEHAAHSQ